MNSIIKIISLLALSLLALCTKVEFNNPLDPQATNYDANKVKDDDGNGKADYYEDEDRDGVINGKDPDWKNYIKDLVPPVFSMSGGDVVTVNRKTEDVQEKYSEFKNQVKATDAKDGDVSNRITVNPEDISTLIDETYDVIFIATDIDNNADTIHRTFKVFTSADVDTVGPRIIIGSTKDTFEFYEGDIYNEPLVSAYDLVDGDVSSTITKSGTVNTAKVGLYTVEYTATDKSNNPTKRTIYVNVLPGSSVDNIYPVISLEGGKDTVKLANGAKWVDPGYTATDNKDGIITDSVRVDTSSFTVKRIDVVCKVIYNVKDKAGNTTTEYRLVQFGKIVQDVPPRFYLEGVLVTKDTTSYSVNLKSKPKTLTAKDKDDRDLTSAIKRSGTFDSTKAGIYDLTYTVEDKDLLKTTLKVKITVVDANKDTTKPVITIKGRNPDTVSVDSEKMYSDSGATAYDLVNGKKIVLTVTTSGEVNRKVADTYKITYTAVDSAGLKTESIRTVVVRDVSNNLLLKYGAPGTAALKTIDQAFTSFTVDGSGPSFSTIKSMTINWVNDAYNQALWTFSISTTTGQYIELKSAANTFKSNQPSVTFTSTGIADLTGKFWVTMSDKDMVWVEETGKYAIVWKP